MFEFFCIGERVKHKASCILGRHVIEVYVNDVGQETFVLWIVDEYLIPVIHADLDAGVSPGFVGTEKFLQFFRETRRCLRR